MKVISVTGGKLPWIRLIVREIISYYLSVPFLIGEFLYFFNTTKQTLHDRIAGSIVIQEHPVNILRKLGMIAVIIILQVIFTLFAVNIAVREFRDNRNKTDLIDSLKPKNCPDADN